MKYAVAYRGFGTGTDIIALEDDLSRAESLAEELDMRFSLTNPCPYVHAMWFEVIEVGVVKSFAHEGLKDFLLKRGIPCKGP
ncbi:hypothetical protein KC850_01190 [Candidatus Kaiserbacteria bacterium]|nr:hypothetical protein [Candidatus Kaiserbacteria bacterium]MCB9817903.1 hypothetical protein [Candidatus Nomurabacteria bacterium]